MKKFLIASILALALVLSLVGVAGAITNGVPDGNKHPYVGILIFDPPVGTARWRCTGALIAPTVVLTAGHCTDGAAAARVWFVEKLQAADGSYLVPDYPTGGEVAVEGTPYTHPDYRSPDNPYGGGNGLPAFSYRDVGVVVLDDPVYMDKMAKLPTEGLVDTLKNKTPIDFVGYGVQDQVILYPGQSPRARWTGLRNRMYAPSELVSGKFVHSAEYMRFALNPGGGSGGTCFGDSGGPDLLVGTNTVLAVNSYVTNSNCTGVGYSARVDTEAALSFINSYLR